MPGPGLAALLIVLAATGSWFWRAYKVDIPKEPLPYAAAWASGAALGLVSLLFFDGGTAAGLAAALGALFFYFVMTGAQRAGETQVRVGDQLPAFQAVDDTGTVFDSAELAGRPALLKFFRGHW